MRGIYQVRLEALKLEAPAFCEFSTSMYGMLKVNCLMRQEITKVATVLQKQCLGTPKAKGYLLYLFRIRIHLLQFSSFSMSTLSNQ